MEDQALKYFITEELFVIPGTEKEVEQAPAPERPPSNVPEPKKELDHHKLAIATEKLNSDEELLLGKILMAVGQDLKSIPVFVYPIELDFTFDRLIVFGGQYQQYTDIEKYFIKGDQQQFVIASKLSTISSSKEEKTKLWTTLKSWFGV